MLFPHGVSIGNVAEDLPKIAAFYKHIGPMLNTIALLG